MNLVTILQDPDPKNNWRKTVAGVVFNYVAWRMMLITLYDPGIFSKGILNTLLGLAWFAAGFVIFLVGWVYILATPYNPPKPPEAAKLPEPVETPVPAKPTEERYF